MGLGDSSARSPLFVSSRDYFEEIVTDAFEHRKMKVFPLVKAYLVELLEFYVPASNLFDDVDESGKRTRQTLAETFLRAQNVDSLERIELLKKLGDRSLYISGFFGDSLQRKLVDIDYYADMGGMAYGALERSVREDSLSRIYGDFARRFLEYVDVLTYISTQAHLQNESNVMRLFELYQQTGSETAREKLMEKGIIAPPLDAVPKKKQ